MCTAVSKIKSNMYSHLVIYNNNSKWLSLSETFVQRMATMAMKGVKMTTGSNILVLWNNAASHNIIVLLSLVTNPMN